MEHYDRRRLNRVRNGPLRLMDKEQIAREAQNLRDNEIFQRALSAMRADCLERLAAIPPEKTNDIRDFQAQVRVVDNLRGNLEAFIRAGLPKKAHGIV